MSLAKKMGDAHEAHLAEVYGGRVTPGSGNQFNRPMDGRQSRYERAVAFAWDGKSTRSDTISITRSKMLAKAKEQAHGEVPMIALRWYEDDRLQRFEDWAAIPEHALVELLERSDRLVELEAKAKDAFWSELPIE